MTLPSNFLYDGSGAVLCWSGDRGTAFAALPRLSSLAPEQSRYVGNGETVGEAPMAIRYRGGVVVAFSDTRGVGVVQEETERLVLPGCHSAGLCASGPVVHVGGVDSEGVWLATGEEQPVRISSHRDAHLLHLVAAGGGVVAVFLLSQSLAVVRVDADGQLREVVHALKHPPTSLDVASTGNRLAVVIGYGREHIDLTLLNASGNTLERVHSVLNAKDARPLEQPSVFWHEVGFVVSARNPRTEEIRLTWSGAQTLPTFFRTPRPLHVRSFSKVFYGASVYNGELGALAEFHAIEPGLQSRLEPVLIEPSDRVLQERRLRARVLVGQVAARAISGGYRDGLATTANVDTLSGEFVLPTRRGGTSIPIAFEVLPQHTGVRITMRRGEPNAQVEPSSLIRLAAWVRSRWSKAERIQKQEDEAWALSLLSSDETLSLTEVVRTGDHTLIGVSLNELPKPEQLMAWLRAVAQAEDA